MGTVGKGIRPGPRAAGILSISGGKLSHKLDSAETGRQTPGYLGCRLRIGRDGSIRNRLTLSGNRFMASTSDPSFRSIRQGGDSPGTARGESASEPWSEVVFDELPRPNTLTTDADPHFETAPSETGIEAEFADEFAPAGTASESELRQLPLPVTWSDRLRSASRGTMATIRMIRKAGLFGCLRAIGRGLLWLIRTLFGIASLILMLALIAAVPVLNLYSLGYLLAVEGRVARSGRLRDAFPLLELAPRLGVIALGIWAWLVPLRVLSDVAADAHLVDPGSGSDRGLHLLVKTLSVVISVHLCLALARGGSFWTFLRPIKNFHWLRQRFEDHNYWQTAEQQVTQFVRGLQIRHHFWLGLRGFVGAIIWLAPPTLLFSATTKTEGGPLLLTLIGGIWLSVVLSWVPFLQAHLAAEDRFRAMFELRTIRKMYGQAPFSWLFTMLITLTLSLPLYLFKIALPPRDLMWLVTIIFIMSIYPAKVLTGWAYYRAKHRERRSHFVFRWATWLVLQPLLLSYVFLLFFTQFIGKYGKLVLFEHHAFMLPVPF